MCSLILLSALPEIAVRFAAVLHERLVFRHWIAISMKGTYPRGKKLYPAHYALLYYTRGVPKTFNRVRLLVPYRLAHLSSRRVWTSDRKLRLDLATPVVVREC